MTLRERAMSLLQYLGIPHDLAEIGSKPTDVEAVEAHLAAVRDEEREACARLCESEAVKWKEASRRDMTMPVSHCDQRAKQAEALRDSIRARGAK